MEPVEAAPEEDPPAEISDPPKEEPSNNAEPTVKEFLDSAPADVRAVLNQGLRLQEAQRVSLTSVIKANDGNKFTDEQLAGFDLEQLENMASLTGPLPADYTGVGHPRTPTVNTEDIGIPDMPLVFPVKAA